MEMYKNLFEFPDNGDETWSGSSDYYRLTQRKNNIYYVSLLLSQSELSEIEDLKITYENKLPPFCLCTKWSQMTCADESIMENR